MPNTHFLVASGTTAVELPSRGVYRWYYKGKDLKPITIYVGKSEPRKKHPLLFPRTVERGCSEARQGAPSSGKRKKLDTDFVVGTALQFVVEKRHVDCYWEHLSDKPEEEELFCKEHKPRLQKDGSTRIKNSFKQKEDKSEWKKDDSSTAREWLFGKFDAEFP